MLQLRLYFVQFAFNASGSAVTQRGEDVVSGRMMPTLAPLPSIPPDPPAGVDATGVDAGPPAGVEFVVVLFLLELQAVTASSAAPRTAIETVVLRMRRSRLSAWWALWRGAEFVRQVPMNVVRANISRSGRCHRDSTPTCDLIMLGICSMSARVRRDSARAPRSTRPVQGFRARQSGGVAAIAAG